MGRSLADFPATDQGPPPQLTLAPFAGDSYRVYPGVGLSVCPGRVAGKSPRQQARGDTIGDTNGVAPGLPEWQNLGEMQANTMAAYLPERAIYAFI